jgi:hypothetical protein
VTTAGHPAAPTPNGHEEDAMSVRSTEFARLEAAGWTVLVDSPWPRLAQRLRTATWSALRWVFRPAGRPA